MVSIGAFKGTGRLFLTPQAGGRELLLFKESDDLLMHMGMILFECEHIFRSL